MLTGFAAPPCQYTPEIPALLATLNCSLVVSTNQANKIMLLSAATDNTLRQHLHSFDRPMGIAVRHSELAIATRNEIVVLTDTPHLVSPYLQHAHIYDALFVPQTTYLCGTLDIHDLVWGGDTLWAVNTCFSCICRITQQFSVEPLWTPPFISQLAPEDRCHLNGLALLHDQPRYVTALGTTNTAKGWRNNRLHGGVLLDMLHNEILLANLPMPHSPRVYHEQLFVLLSASGQLIAVDPQTRRYEVITQLPGFARGLAGYGDYLFAGVSHLRKQHRFGDLPIAQWKPFCGIVVIHLPSSALCASIECSAVCEEIYDIQILPGVQRPGILTPDGSME